MSRGHERFQIKLSDWFPVLLLLLLLLHMRSWSIDGLRSLAF
jgi:hypothetical protein